MQTDAAASGAERPIAPERRLRVAEVRKTALLTPHMKRVTIGSAALVDFPVQRPAQWVKVFVPISGGDKPSGRAYTIRRLHRQSGEMDIDFVLHGDGPCSTWAANARVGDVVQITGPRSGFLLGPEVPHLLIGGDETALPAIGSILEQLRPDLRVTAYVEIPEKADEQLLPTLAKAETVWLPRNGQEPGTATALIEAMMSAPPLGANCDVWFAAEASVVHTVRRHFQLDRGVERSHLTMSGYWKRGETDFRDRDGNQ